MKDRTTTIGVKEKTRRRLRYACDFKLHVEDYDAGINALLDKAGYPTYEEIETSANERAADDTRAQAAGVA